MVLELRKKRNANLGHLSDHLHLGRVSKHGLPTSAGCYEDNPSNTGVIIKILIILSTKHLAQNSDFLVRVQCGASLNLRV